MWVGAMLVLPASVLAGPLGLVFSITKSPNSLIFPRSDSKVPNSRGFNSFKHVLLTPSTCPVFGL